MEKTCVLDFSSGCKNCRECELCDMEPEQKCIDCMECILGDEESRYLDIEEVEKPKKLRSAAPKKPSE